MHRHHNTTTGLHRSDGGPASWAATEDTKVDSLDANEAEDMSTDHDESDYEPITFDPVDLAKAQLRTTIENRRRFGELCRAVDEKALRETKETIGHIEKEIVHLQEEKGKETVVKHTIEARLKTGNGGQGEESEEEWWGRGPSRLL